MPGVREEIDRQRHAAVEGCKARAQSLGVRRLVGHHDLRDLLPEEVHDRGVPRRAAHHENARVRHDLARDEPAQAGSCVALGLALVQGVGQSRRRICCRESSPVPEAHLLPEEMAEIRCAPSGP